VSGRLIFEITHWMGLIPVIWLGTLAYCGQRRSPLWWALALVLAVSWVADTVAHVVDPWLVSAIYPLLQALILSIILLPRRALQQVAAVLIGIGALTLWLGGATHPEVIGRTIAWTGLLVVAWPHHAIRWPVIITFGLGWLGWIAYSISPGWWTWGIFQSIRAVGLGSFCWVSAPRLVRV